jgi:hypothetical protein
VHFLRHPNLRELHFFPQDFASFGPSGMQEKIHMADYLFDQCKKLAEQQQDADDFLGDLSHRYAKNVLLPHAGKYMTTYPVHDLLSEQTETSEEDNVLELERKIQAQEFSATDEDTGEVDEIINTLLQLSGKNLRVISH